MTGNIEPRGIIAIMTTPDGSVVDDATDYGTEASVFHDVWRAQAARATAAVKHKAVFVYASDFLAAHLTACACEQIANSLLKSGHKITLHAIGWGEDVAAEVRKL